MLHVWGVVKTPSSVSEMRTVDHYMTYCQHLIWIVTEMAIRRYLDRPALLHQYINIGMLLLDFHNYLQDFQLSKHTQIKAFILKKLSVQSSTHDTHHDSNDIGT